MQGVAIASRPVHVPGDVRHKAKGFNPIQHDTDLPSEVSISVCTIVSHEVEHSVYNLLLNMLIHRQFMLERPPTW